MISIFNVSDLNIISDGSEREVLRFLPSRNFKKNISELELIKRIFTEDITAESETKISEILQKLIYSDPQPDTAEEIMQNLNILGYPYLANSAVYDFKYLNWSKLGKGNIAMNNFKYTLTESGIQRTNIFPSSAANIEITATISQPNASLTTRNLIYLYTTLDTSSTAYPAFALRYETASKQYLIRRRSTNNGSLTTGTTYTETFEHDEPITISFVKNSDGTAVLGYYPTPETFTFLSIITSTSTFNPRSIRINFAANSTTTTTSGIIKLDNLKIIVNGVTVSQLNP